jgi:hypothetical protein
MGEMKEISNLGAVPVLRCAQGRSEVTNAGKRISMSLDAMRGFRGTDDAWE